MKQIMITKSTLSGNIKIISSKSLSHRYVIAASMAKGISTINNVLNSKDLEATTNILLNLGAKITIDEFNNYTVENSKLTNPVDKVLDAYESGSTLRFFIPISWTLENDAIFTGSKTLGTRSLSVYEKIAKEENLLLEKTNNNFPLKVGGKLRSGKFYIDGSISSQFITGLLYALPKLEADSEIIFTKPLSSKGYIDLTLETLKRSGIVIVETTNGYLIPGNQNFKAININIEGDYSQAAFFIVAAIITNSELTISNLNLLSKQGDKEILEIIRKMGVNYLTNNDGITILKNNKLKPMTIDLFDIPDLGPILMVLASTIKDETRFLNIDRLYDKESNRYEAMKNNLVKLGVSFSLDNNTLIVKGISKFDFKDLVFDTYNDHRIAMALSVLALINEKPVIINDYEVVSKSYPNFFEELIKIGGNVTNVK